MKICLNIALQDFCTIIKLSIHQTVTFDVSKLLLKTYNNNAFNISDNISLINYGWLNVAKFNELFLVNE